MVSARSLCTILVFLASPTLASADLRFFEPTADLGELRGGSPCRHRFEFVNDSSEAIEILDLRLGCGCLQPVLEKRAYQPGEKGSLVMHLRTLGQPAGSRTWQARVQYRQGQNLREADLLLAATIRNEVTVEPSILAMSVESTLRQEVILTDHRPLPMKVAKVLASTPAVRVSTQMEGARITRVILEVHRADLTADRQEETLNIYTDDPHYRHLQVPITLMKANRSAVSATPDRVELRGPGPASKLVRLRATGDQKVTIERAEADHPAVKCVWASGPGNDATLKITIDAQLVVSGNSPVNVRIQLREPSTTTLTIPIVVAP